MVFHLVRVDPGSGSLQISSTSNPGKNELKLFWPGGSDSDVSSALAGCCALVQM